MPHAPHATSTLHDQAARVLATTTHAWGVSALSLQPAPCPPRYRLGTTRAARAARRMHRTLSTHAPVAGLFFAI